MDYAIGIDIGGTTIAIAIVDRTGILAAVSEIPTDTSLAPGKIIDKVNSEIEYLLTKEAINLTSIIGIGIGAPGPLDSNLGTIISPPNLPLWTSFPIVEMLYKKWGVPILLENDANAACLAEQWLGNGQDSKHFIYLTVSTGIGAGIMADGKLLNGKKGNAGDIGHMVVDPSFGACVCGQFGCLESIASGTAIARLGSKAAGRKVSTKEVFHLYEAGHKEITILMEKILRVLGAGCVSLINIFDTEKIIIGGGVSKAGEVLCQAIQHYISQYALSPEGRKVKVVPAKFREHAGVIGAAALLLKPV